MSQDKSYCVERNYNVTIKYPFRTVTLENRTTDSKRALSNSSRLIESFPLAILESVLLYDVGNDDHTAAALRYHFPLKVYYQQVLTINNEATWNSSSPRPTVNCIIINGTESFSEFQTKWQNELKELIVQKRKAPADIFSEAFRKTRYLALEDTLNPSHFVLASFILLLISFLAPAPLLLCSLIAGVLAAPALLGYLAIKSSNDFQLLNEYLWNPLVESNGFPEKIKQKSNSSEIPSCMPDTLAAQAAIEQQEGSLQAYKNSTGWQLLAYVKALPIRGITWMNKHFYQTLTIGLGILALAILMMCMVTIPAFPFNPFDFISHQLVEGIQGIIAWAPDTLGFLNNLITPVATDVISGIIFLAGSLSVIDNVRRIGRALYAAHGNVTEKFEGADPDDFVELKIDPYEGLYKNYVVDSYRHTILWRKSQVENESDLQITTSLEDAKQLS